MLHGKQDRELEDDGASLKSFTGRPVSRHREFPQTSSHGENLGLIIIIGSCKRPTEDCSCGPGELCMNKVRC